MNDTVNKLSQQLLEAYSSERNQSRIHMWKRHNNGLKTGKIPVNVHLFKGAYLDIWRELIPPQSLLSTDEIERHIELQLRQQLYKYNIIQDDDVVLPTIWVSPVFKDKLEPNFGANTKIDKQGISYKAHTVVNTSKDIEKLKYPIFDIDAKATKTKLDKYTEALGGKLPVKIKSNFLGESPFDTVCKLREMTQLMFDCIDNPSLVHELMGFVTDGHIEYHLERDQKGFVEPEESYGFRVHCDESYGDEKAKGLKNSWAYVSAQSSAMLSPDMYAEFIHPYNSKLASIYGKVYYHGCENLTEKADIISNMPGLTRFHVSPWTDLEKIVKKFKGRFILEVHVHPTETLFIDNEKKMQESIQRIIDIAGNYCIDINLSDIETVKGNASRLSTWSKIAQEVTARNM